MREIYEGYKKEIKERKLVLILVFIIFIVGLLFGSIYITIIDNDSKKLIMDSVNSYFISFNDITFSSKLDIFKNSLTSNLLYFCFMWLIGISVIGIPIIFIMIFLRSFKIGFTMAGIFAKYKFIGLLGIIVYIFPSNLFIILLGLFLACYSVNLSINMIKSIIIRKSIDFKAYFGKYIFILLVSILISIFCALFDAFLSPLLFKLINNLLLS